MMVPFTIGAVLEAPETKEHIVVIDSYALDAKNIVIITVCPDFDICIIKYNIETDEAVQLHNYDTVSIVSQLRKQQY